MTLAVLADPPKGGRPRSRFYEIARRIARRFEPAVARAFLAAVNRLQRQIDAGDLEQAVASGNLDTILAAVASGGDLAQIMDASRLAGVLQQTATATGRAGADVLSGVTGITAQFNALDPAVVMFARTQAARLIVAVTEDVREAVRIITSTAQVLGLTVQQQARAITEVVGLPPNWANAPTNLGKELRAGQFTASRRLSATDKAQIRSRLAKGTVDEAFVAKMEKRYSESLIRARANSIARTETLAASHYGQRQGWKQAIKAGVLPKTARRVFVVTPDDRLRESHAAVPGLNPGGVGMDEPFITPLGPKFAPPIEPNCRCGEGLIFPGMSGTI